jgi:uncharacterized protein
MSERGGAAGLVGLAAVSVAVALGCGASGPAPAVRRPADRGSAPDEPERMVDRVARACDRGDARACASLGEQYERGRGVDRDIRTAAELYEMACVHGLAEACTVLGTLFEMSDGLPRDHRRAAALYVMACEEGEPVACKNLGIAYRLGKGVRQSASRAARFFLKACDMGHGSGCAALALLFRRGEGVVESDEASLFLELKGCLSGHASSCRAIDPAPAHGAPPRPRDLAARARHRCTAGDEDACVVLGHLIRHGRQGRGAPRGAVRAAELYRRACDMNRAFGCLALGEMFARGEGLPVDARRAAHLRARACELDALACGRDEARE